VDAKYLTLLAENKLAARVEALEALLGACTVCPKDCGNDRLNGEIAACYSGRLPIVSSYTAHFGEEPCLSGVHGVGNIFFGNCNLRCVYCQNYQISQTWREQQKNEVTHERLAEMMLELQDRGCHNIGFVSPTHFAPQMARAILIAARQGLTLPIVYNTNAYDSVEVLRLLDGIVDVYLPDLKYADSDAGFQYSKVRDYKEHAHAAIKEMHRQMGDGLVFDDDGLLKRGLMIRLLVLPNGVGSATSCRPVPPFRLWPNTTRPTRPRATRVTSCFRVASPKANGSRPSLCFTISASTKDSCRNTSRHRITTGRISKTRRNPSGIFGIFSKAYASSAVSALRIL
jgi:putative pyruvate formate lyase activating enzyme